MFKVTWLIRGRAGIPIQALDSQGYTLYHIPCLEISYGLMEFILVRFDGKVSWTLTCTIFV